MCYFFPSTHFGRSPYITCEIPILLASLAGDLIEWPLFLKKRFVARLKSIFFPVSVKKGFVARLKSIVFFLFLAKKWTRVPAKIDGFGPVLDQKRRSRTDRWTPTNRNLKKLTPKNNESPMNSAISGNRKRVRYRSRGDVVLLDLIILYYIRPNPMEHFHSKSTALNF